MASPVDRVTRETELRKLSHHHSYQLAYRINDRSWKILMMSIPKDLRSLQQEAGQCPQTEFKYTQEHIRMIEDASKTDRLPGQILLDEWGTSGRLRPTVEHLLVLLIKQSLYRAADYLAQDILQENAPVRPKDTPAATVDVDSMFKDSGSGNFDSGNQRIATPPRLIESSSSNGETRNPSPRVLMGATIESTSSQGEENSNAPTLSTNIDQSDPVVLSSGFSNSPAAVPSDVIPMLTFFGAVAGSPVVQTNGGEPQSEQMTTPQSEERIYQSGVPNISLFGGKSIPIISESSFANGESLQRRSSSGGGSSSGTTSTPDSSASVSERSQASNTGQTSFSHEHVMNNSLPMLSFLGMQQQQPMTTTTTTTPNPRTESVTVEKFNFAHLLNCTDNFNGDPFTGGDCGSGFGGRKLGAGGFGSVHLAVNLSPEIPVAAVKRLHRNFDQVRQKFELEIKILSEHSHENMVRLLGYAATEDDGDSGRVGELCLIYELVAGGNLERRLEQSRMGEVQLHVQRRLSIAVGVARGINYLHSAKLAHRDVKSANVLLDMEDVPKLCDFGLLRPLNSRTTTMAVGSSGYMAPEIVRGTSDYEKVDTFAFGVLQLELLTGLPVISAGRREDLVSFVERELGASDEIAHLLDTTAGHWSELGQRWYAEAVLKAIQLSPNRRSTIGECLRALEQLMTEL